ncbi:MAG: RNA polymerase sigma factor [Planctomycetota bacterium]|nr:RNA polymerase sigma factor [Planctomycetota bacterium]
MDANHKKNPTHSLLGIPSEGPAVTDEQLLLEYRETGGRDLFSRLVKRYERELFWYLCRFLGNAEMAEDAFQSAFLQVHLKCDQFEEGRRFRPWLYTIATNQAIDSQRRQKRHKALSLDHSGNHSDNDEVCRLVNLLESGEDNPIEYAERIERCESVRNTLNSLPESMTAVVQLVYYQGMKYREAAEVLNIPVGTVKSRLHAAISKLTEVWSESQSEIAEK